MNGISIGQVHPRPCSGEKTLRRCRNNGEANKVILIDVDAENFDNVVIIDVPESLPKKAQSSSMHGKDQSWSLKNVIYIDDDENHDTNHPLDDNNASFYAGTSYNRKSCRVIKKIRDSAFEESRYDQDTVNLVRLSKCKRTYCGKCCQRNRYGLSADSESDSSDNDCPDCELDSSGKVQEQWEKASSRRKKDLQNVHSDNRVHDMTSLAFVTGKLNCEKDGPSCSGTKEDTDIGLTHAFDTEVNKSRCSPTDKHENCTETATGKSRGRKHLKSGQSRATGSAKEMVKIMPDKCTRSTLHHKQADRGSTILSDANGSVSGKSSSSKDYKNTHLYKAKLRKEISLSNIQQGKNKNGHLHSQNGKTVPSVETSIINEQEKHKKTNKYKRAMEEEWASRKQALQIQAEEAKRLRRLQKRKEIENSRLLERRQKERLEEVRNIQKKDEEDMNLKERVRAEVRMELNNFEVSCHSLASLLHLLGISVGGWPNPLPQQKAYKRALLTFHPDRASQSDIRQQVEAEEKFKLINRLKEKFSPNL